ncbi:ABC transporter substrate-binding protein [Pasteurella atlantica]|uniref:heme/hemin ABC transporter substrate-binding protein n=1 Tax=Pasteurellaceae TaxID=712 RepID=UPI00274B9E16|nr:ABC transporter substrate-binding protein [Pasteurella atlantica]MDP8032755.1 ABC transporter substrate-binding protein [Pasteurella atlantica]MDP8034739.1 ABC transporter substrate-binding protein [Pasteurella atlantica]MDP8036689.1 ABC transporter substrate-binding protein [Pasteurella atlantica]MDP8046989.1 ABC transporter substrate-binding protein [Pasteurella atlantica]MDP8048942.1 ABC transporter substrate-binding protein [Pasteurella atlantica]
MFIKTLIANLHSKALNKRKISALFVLTTLSASINAESYHRIVSTTGNASQIIAELGLADDLIAVDTTSTLPADIMKNKPKIGYRRALSSEGILAMRPDLVVLVPDAGPPNVIAQLKSSKVETITITDKKSLEGVVDDIQLIAKTLDATEQAKPLIERINKDKAEITKIIESYPTQPKIAFFMDGGVDRFMGFGDETAGDGMIDIVGSQNIFKSQFKSVKPVSLEALSVSDMDMIIIASHSGKDRNPATLTKALDKYTKLAITKAGQKDCVFTIGIVEGLGFGPDLTQPAKEITQAAKECVTQEEK